MSKLCLALLIVSLSILHFSCDTHNGTRKELTENQISKISCYTKVWGFLKYYHPGMVKGQVDWDSVCVNELPKILNSNKKRFGLCLDALIDLPGNIQQHDSSSSIFEYPNEWTRNLNLEWINHHPLLSKNQSEKLKYILENRQKGPGFYVDYQWDHSTQSGPVKFINEKAYDDSLVVADYRYRILSLARYWNTVEYFFAYKYLLSKEWNSILIEYIPQLYEETSILDYNLDLYRLAREIEDSHSGGTYSNHLFQYHWNKKVPFDVITIDGRTLVSNITYETLNSVNDIIVGDEIVLIDSDSVGEVRANLRQYCIGSNDPNTESATDNLLLNGNSDKVTLTIVRNGETQEVIVDRFPFETFWTIEQKDEPIATFSEDFSYIKLVLLDSKEEIDSIMHLAKVKPNIIFDLRDYPMFNAYDLEAHFLNESARPFNAFEPSLDDVGVFKPSTFVQQQLDSRKHYDGNVFVLVNEYTQSYAESIAMFFQTLPNVTMIGSQTAGANGNTASVILPGRIRASFSNLIIEYPDGSQSQKTGIKIDHKVEVTIEDVINQRDPYKELAEKLIKNL